MIPVSEKKRKEERIKTTIEKAIERLQSSLDHNTILMTQEDKDALRLAIEALKRIQACRPPFGRDDHSALPGETPPKPLHALGFNAGDDESP